MSKYKHIKKHPGSPELGIIIDTSKIKSGKFGWFEKDLFTGGYIQKNYLIKDVIEYPEFWEEIIEKDYEILSIKYKDNLFTNVGKWLSITFIGILLLGFIFMVV